MSLWRASENGNIDGVRSALSNGAEIDSRDDRIDAVSTNYITIYIPISNLFFYVILYSSGYAPGPTRAWARASKSVDIITFN